MKVNIVCYEDVNAWILGKFARKMNENLLKLGIESKISKKSDPLCDINHHIIYVNYDSKASSIDTLMISHIDDSWKLKLISYQLTVAQLGICMSKETVEKLTALGIPGNRLTYVNPAHDGIIKPRKIVIGITCMVQDDGRKREVFLDRLAKELDPEIFMFKIMGRNWDTQIRNLTSNGIEVEYFRGFDYEKYIQLIPSLDYYLYMGQDEGQMGFLDALSAGVKTIVTPQGYHLDARNGITYPFNTYEELLSVFKTISIEKRQLVDSVRSWNWEQYTLKHLELWKYLLATKNNYEYKIPENIDYQDGISSLLQSPVGRARNFNNTREIYKLRKEYIRHLAHKIKNRAALFFFRKK